MNNSIKDELTAHVRDLIADGVITKDNLDDAHLHAFNEDYYIIGYYNADQWLKKHDVSPWEAIQYVIEQEQAHFGEVSIQAQGINAETIVNNLVFFAGYEIDIESIFNQEQAA